MLIQDLGSEMNTLNISELKNGLYTYKVLNNNTVSKIGKLIFVFISRNNCKGTHQSTTI